MVAFLRDRNRVGQRPRRHGRAVLRPGLRVRSDAAVAHIAGGAHVRQPGASDGAVPGRVAGLDVHRMDDELARSGTAAGADRPVRPHSHRLVHVGVDSALVRGARHRVRGRLCNDAGRPRAVRSVDHAPRSAAAGADVSAHRRLDDAVRRVLDRRRRSPSPMRGWRGGRWRSASRCSVRGRLYWVPGLGRSAVADWNVDGGHMAERCATVHHHRAGRVAARHRRDVRRADVGRADAGRVLQRGGRQHPDVVDLLRHRRAARGSIA